MKPFMFKNKRLLLAITLCLLLSVFGCQSQEMDDGPINHKVSALYEKNSNVVGVSYDDLNMQGLAIANGTVKIYESASSLTFGEYDNGDIGCIKYLDLANGNYCGYEMFVKAGDNAKYPFWALTYLNENDDVYYEMLEKGIDEDKYKTLPFMACDSMSFGYTDDGDRSSLYATLLFRNMQIDDNDNPEWLSKGTCPDASIRCSVKSLPAMIAANCITVEQALAFIGAVNEDYYKVYPNTEPGLDIFVDEDDLFETLVLEDSSGRHGVLEIIDNTPIWHEGLDYSFNYFVNDDYLLNEDSTYKEEFGKGLGRYNATVPYLDSIDTMDDHLRLMNNISLSNLAKYDEENGHTGTDYVNKQIDWRSEFVGYDVFANYDNYFSLKLNTEIADEKYPLYAYYFDKDTEMNVLIDSYDKWVENKDHLECIYDANYCLDDKNYNELLNLIRWNGQFIQSLSSEEMINNNLGYTSFIKVIADPMNYRVNRWFNEEITTSNTVEFEDVCNNN